MEQVSNISSMLGVRTRSLPHSPARPTRRLLSVPTRTASTSSSLRSLQREYIQDMTSQRSLPTSGDYVALHYLLEKHADYISYCRPGADDDGSGTVTILEALRVLLLDQDIIEGKQENTVEFHWYSAEEGGLLGSQAIFQTYEKTGRDVKAMLQQDMTGYVQKTLDAGEPESVGVITDFVDPGLTEFIKKVVTTYCDIPYVLTKCGYACSDHASASKAGYPSAFVSHGFLYGLETRLTNFR